MDEGRVERGFQERLARRLRRFDVKAEEVVMLDLELPDTCLGSVRRLQFRDHTATFVTQAPRLIKRGQGARADEPAVALEQRQLVGERSAEITLKLAAICAEARVGAAQLGRKIRRALENAGQSRRGGEPVANGGEVARPAAVEAQARERP